MILKKYMLFCSTSSSSAGDGAGSAAARKPGMGMAKSTVAEAIQVPVAIIRAEATPHAIVPVMTFSKVIIAARAITEMVVKRGIKDGNHWIMSVAKACGAKEGSRIEIVKTAIVKEGAAAMLIKIQEMIRQTRK